MGNQTYCGIVEHEHTEKCFETALICAVTEESSGHSHVEECYQVDSSLICEQEESEVVMHEHDSECYEKKAICGIGEHLHTLICYSDGKSDIETAEVWELTIPKDLTGVWVDDLILVAESQLGYSESTANYIVENDNVKGYTRYGEWYGEPYADWSTLYVSFCLYYAGIDEELIVKVENSNIPQKGDLVFFQDSEEGIGKMGIVVEASGADNTLKTIEGDAGDAVKYVNYELNDASIIGFGKIPSKTESKDVEKPTDENVSENTQSISYEDDTMTIIVQVPKEVTTLDNTELKVTKLEEDDEAYIADSTVMLDPSIEILEHSQYSIALVDENEIPVIAEEIDMQVTMQYQPVTETSDEPVQTRLMEVSQEETKILSETDVNEGEAFATTFSTRSLGTYDIMVTAAGDMSRAVTAGKYGQYNLSYNDKKDAFVRDPVYDKYYNENSPLGTAGSFHLVGFGTVTLGTHTNGNVLANKLIANSNFGTNNYEDELTYAQTFERVNSQSASTLDHILVVGSNNTITIGGNNDQVLINGTKMDKPYNIVQDHDTAIAPFIDLNRVENEIKGISARLASVPTTGVTVNFVDENNRSIVLNNANGTGYYTTTAKDLQKISNFSDRRLQLKGFAKDHNGTIVINVDCTGVTEFRMPPALMYIGDQEQQTNETVKFSTGKIVWNFTNAEGITIYTKRMLGMVIAPGASVELLENLNGTVVAENIHVKAESHRTDFTGEIDDPGSVESDTTGAYVKVRKVDYDNFSIYLAGARFDLYLWDADQNQYVIASKDLTYEGTGLLYLDDLHYNRAYKLVETKAPDGYRISSEPYYFMLENSDTTKYPVVQPSDFKGNSFTLGQTIYFRNEKMEELEIEKKWISSEGTAFTPPETEIQVDLWQNVYQDAERTVLLRSAVYQTGIPITAANDWKITFTNLPKRGSENVDGMVTEVYYAYFVKEEEMSDYNVDYAGNYGVTNGVITITNLQKVKYALPATGGSGTYVYTTGGTLLVLAVVLLKFYEIRRREDGI